MFDKSSIAKTIVFSLVLHCSLTNIWSNDDLAERNQKFLGDPGVDVEKARSHMREKRAERLRWELVTTLGDYERVGKKDVRWDDAAREALTQNAHLLAGEREADNRRDEIKGAFQKALSAGCTDPLIGYFSLRCGCYPPSTSPAELANLFANVERSLQASQYAAIRKCYASLRAAEQVFKAHKMPKQNASPDSMNTISALLSRAESQFVTLLRDASANRDSVYDLAENAFFDFARDAASGRSQVFDPLAKFFDDNKSQITGDDPSAGLIEGEFWSQYAWDARSSNWSDEVTREGWKLFAHRLQKAQTILEKAWAKDRADPRIAIGMMTVELGQGKGRERLETWFRRAMNADPDSYDACKKKQLYLEPKWYGSEAETLAFGRKCLDTANWRSRIPFVLLNAHTDLANLSDNQQEYWKRPDVWADVEKLYTACLAANPDSVFDRSGYAFNAYRAEKWKLAAELFARLGDKPNLRAMNCSMEKYEQMRRITAAKANER